MKLPLGQPRYNNYGQHLSDGESEALAAKEAERLAAYEAVNLAIAAYSKRGRLSRAWTSIRASLYWLSYGLRLRLAWAMVRLGADPGRTYFRLNVWP